VDDGVSTPEYGGRVKGCFLLRWPSGPRFGFTKHNMTTQRTRIMTRPTITIATMNSGFSVTGVSVVDISGVLTTRVGVVEIGIDIVVVVVVCSTDDVVVESAISTRIGFMYYYYYYY